MSGRVAEGGQERRGRRRGKFLDVRGRGCGGHKPGRRRRWARSWHTGRLGGGARHASGAGGGRPGCASRETRQGRGGVRAMAAADHGRRVSTPRWVCTSWNAASTCQCCRYAVRMAAGVQSGSVQSRVGFAAPARVAQEHPVQGDGGLARVVPEGRAGGGLEAPPGAVGPALAQGGPHRGRVGRHRLPGGLAGPHDSRPPPPSRPAGRGRIMQDGIQAQPGREGNGRGHGLAGGQQPQAPGQPTSSDHLPRRHFHGRRPVCEPAH